MHGCRSSSSDSGTRDGRAERRLFRRLAIGLRLRRTLLMSFIRVNLDLKQIESMRSVSLDECSLNLIGLAPTLVQCAFEIEILKKNFAVERKFVARRLTLVVRLSMLAKRFQLGLEDLRDGVRLADRTLERENERTDAFEFLMVILFGFDR